ncbi:MAG: beta-ketoacyl-ACP synthase III [Chitinophagales bacterium]|nr:beta-ketoacyl-ACP synthase III [Chitinophagales bacterium]
MKRAKITGVGYYVPEQVVTNDELTQYMETSDEWIQERTGIKQRRFFKEGVDTVSQMGSNAAKMAMERAGVKPADIEMVIFATLSPNYYFPGSGVLLQRELGLREIAVFDIRQQCSGFIYGLSLADQYIRTGTYKTILLVGAEIQSNIMELSDRGRTMSVIFGDGAGAVVIQASDEPGILSTHIYADGTFAEELMQQHPSSNGKTRLTAEMLTDGSMLPYMNGKLVFKHAVVRFPQVIREALTVNGFTEKDIDLLIPHQANIRIAEAVQKDLGLSDGQVFNNIEKYGNTTAASIPIALAEAWEAGKVKQGDLVCLAAFGSGFTWGSALMRW